MSFLRNSPGQFAATAVVSGAVVAGVLLTYQAIRRHEKIENLKSSIPLLDSDHHADHLTDFGAASHSKEDERSAALAARALKGDYDDDLILEQLARNRVFLTEAGLSKLREAYIVVVGCGGVGSHCVAALVRSGVFRIRLIDFDQVSLSSLNRHAVATLADVGIPKVQCLRKRLQAVTPWVSFDCRNQLFSKAEAPSLLEGADFVVDAIDNIDSKVDLLAYCHEHSLRVISSMGAGCKSDPTRVFIGDISTSSEDPLSRSTRRRLRALGIASGTTVVYSTEKPGPGKAQLLPLPEEEFQKGKVGELAPMQDFRVRILPVLGTMPAVFGYAAANYVILSLAGYPMETIETKGREKMYDAILAQVQASEEKLARLTNQEVVGLKVPLTAVDVGYIVEEVYRGRSAISGLPTRLALVRWQKPLTDSMDNSIPGQRSSRLKIRDLVCMTKEEAAIHEREIVRGSKKVDEWYNKEIVSNIEALLDEEIGYEKYR